jgi:transaldolase
MTDPLAALSAAGVSIWLDDLSRDRLTSGSLADLVAHDHVTGVTTTPRSSLRRSAVETPTTRRSATSRPAVSQPARRCAP